ncbi:MAG: RNA pyrophosphohydrolase [Sphingomonas sp.]|nr:RNA pyrophosphohydrolase [Sphingomonas sp.]
MSDPADLPYRPCAGILIVNRDGQLFVGQRLDTIVEAWQPPQGGIDDGEDALAAALREMGEETGIAPDMVTLIAEAPGEFYYDLPDDLVGRIWKGKWRGQRQRWFLFRFHGEDSDVDIATAHQEFRAWRWTDPSQVIELAVDFKRQLYRDVMAAFADHLTPQ